MYSAVTESFKNCFYDLRASILLPFMFKLYPSVVYTVLYYNYSATMISAKDFFPHFNKETEKREKKMRLVQEFSFLTRKIQLLTLINLKKMYVMTMK